MLVSLTETFARRARTFGCFAFSLLVVATLLGACAPDEGPSTRCGGAGSDRCDNSVSCTDSAQCLEGHVCDDAGRCVEAPCEGGDCTEPRCVGAACPAHEPTCAPERGDADCGPDTFCVDGRCVGRSAVCDALGCEERRGVCDAGARACVDAGDCEGDDRRCLEGRFCDDEGRCAPNRCRGDAIRCDRGVCEPGSGECANADVCHASDECLDGFVCVAGACTPWPQACEEACTGNMACSYGAEGTGVVCEEIAGGCLNGFDCAGERVCRAGRCEDAPPCRTSVLERDPLPLEGSAAEGHLPGVTLCAGAAHRFTYRTDGGGLVRGALVVEVRLHPEDVGNGPVGLAIFGPAGEPVADAAVGDRRSLSVEVPVGAAEHGTYTIEVVADATMGTGGARYTVGADFVPAAVAEACAGAAALVDGPLDAHPAPVVVADGDTRNGTTSGLQPGCTAGVAGADAAPEDIYRFELTRPSLVRVEARPEAGFDVALSLRSSCASSAGELACADDEPAGATEHLSTVLAAGIYHLVVKGASADTGVGGGGRYTLQVTSEPVVCTPGRAHCSGAQTTEVCTADGTGWRTEACDEGCDEQSGYCDREPGDTCQVAIDATGGYAGTIEWSRLSNAYDPLGATVAGVFPPLECAPNADGVPHVDGADGAFVVELAPGERVLARLRTAGPFGALWLVDACEAQTSHCLAGAAIERAADVGTGAGYERTLVWENDGRDHRRVFVLADSGADTGGTAQIEIATGRPTCSAGERRCSGDAVEVCDAAQLGFARERDCPAGCAADGTPQCAPAPNGSCRAALDIAGLDIDGQAGRYRGYIEDYDDGFDPLDAGCTGRRSDGPDALFYVDAEAGEVVTAVLDAPFDASLWVTTDCTRAAQTCVAGSDAPRHATELVQFVAPHTGRFYIVVDSIDSPALPARGPFELEVTVELAMCPEGNLIGCTDSNTLSYCGPLGGAVPYRCQTTCTANACDVPAGGHCFDAIEVEAGEVVAGVFTGLNAVRPGPAAGRCMFMSDHEPHPTGPVGADTIYAIALEAGQILDLRGTNTSDDAVFYILEDCGDATSCMATTAGGAWPELRYRAREDRTIYVVASLLRPGADPTASFTLRFEVLTPECVPGEARCEDEDTMRYCSSFGTWEDHACGGGCEASSGGGARCREPGGDVCADAIALSHLDRVTGTFTGSNHLEPARVTTTPACRFLPSDGVGADTIYTVSLEAGQRLQVEATSAALFNLYLLDACTDLASCRQATRAGQRHRLEHIAERDETLYVVVDLAYVTAAPANPYELFVTIDRPGCTPGAVACLEDATTIGVCGDDATLQYYGCPDGCAGERCNTPRGGLCQDSIPLLSGQRVSGRFDGENPLTFDPLDQGACSLAIADAAANDGQDTIYAVDMLEGQLLRAHLTSATGGAYMYVLDDCLEGSASCVESSGIGRDVTLEHLAGRDGTFYLVVSRTTRGQSQLGFDLEITVQTPGCVEGTIACLDDGSTLGRCDATGLWDTYRCEDGCIEGACATPRGDVCHDAVWLDDGARVTGTFTGTATLDPGAGLVGACHFPSGGAPGQDTIYAMLVPAGHVLHARLTTPNQQAYLYLLEDCASAATCLAAEAAGSGGELLWRADADREVYLVVDHTVSNRPSGASANFELAVDLRPTDCAPGARSCGAGGTVGVCDATGTFVYSACSSGSCTDGMCDAPTGYTCHEAIPLTVGQAVTGNWLPVRPSAHAPAAGANGQCQFAHAMAGPETIYAVELRAGQVLRATLEAAVPFWSFYILGSCGEVDTCRALTTSAGEALHHVASEDETVYLVVDYRFSSGNGTHTATFTLETELVAPECAPGARECTGSDSARECLAAGQWLETPCEFGCVAGACQPRPGDTCEAAIALVPGAGSVTGGWAGTNAIDPGAGVVGACHLPAAARGADTVYAIDAEAGQVLRARLTAAHAAATMYLLETCGQPDSCLAAAPHHGASTLLHRVEQTGTLYLVVDRTTAGANGAGFELEVDVLAGDACFAGESRCAGGMLEVCDPEFAIWQQHACAGACVDGRCEAPGGDRCHDAIVAGDGAQFTDVFSGATPAHDPGSSQGHLSGCFYGQREAAPGADRVFALALEAGDLLVATLSGRAQDIATTAMYVLDGCDRPDPAACTFGVRAEARLEFYAPETGTYYVVVDSLSPAASNTAKVGVAFDVHAGAAVCQPGATRCDAAAGTLEVCNDDGTAVVTTAQCAHGCDRRFCAGPHQPNDTCTTAASIDGPVVIFDRWSRMTNALDPGAASCTGVAAPGSEAVYHVALDPGEVLRVRARSVDATERPVVYLVTDCHNPGQSCVAASAHEPSASYDPVENGFEYASPGGTYHLVVDSRTTGFSDAFILEVEFDQAACTPGARRCSVDGRDEEVCTGSGTWSAEPCPYGCAEGRCIAVDNDTCDTALDVLALPGAPGAIDLVVPIDGLTNRHDPAAPGPSCTGSAAAGPEAVFYVDLARNDRVVARMQPGPGATDLVPALWVTEDCAAGGRACIAGAMDESSARVEFVAPHAGRYYILADTFYDAADDYGPPPPGGHFRLELSVSAPLCDTHDAVCLDADTLGTCAPDGSAWRPYPCQDGCADARCTTPRGGTCHDPIPLTASGTITGTLVGQTDAHDPGFGGCTGFDAPGPDLVYAIDLAAGQSLHAVAESLAQAPDDLALYIVSMTNEDVRFH